MHELNEMIQWNKATDIPLFTELRWLNQCRNKEKKISVSSVPSWSYLSVSGHGQRMPTRMNRGQFLVLKLVVRVVAWVYFVFIPILVWYYYKLAMIIWIKIRT